MTTFHGKEGGEQSGEQDQFKDRKVSLENRGKPALKLYQPPNRRYLPNTVNYQECQDNFKMNPYVSKKYHERDYNANGRFYGVQHSKSSGNILLQDSMTSKVHFKMSHSKHSPKSDLINTPVGILKRSKSFGTGETRTSFRDRALQIKASESAETKMNYGLSLLDEESLIEKMGNFSHEAEILIKSAIADPNSLTARNLMELTRYLFQHLIENVKNSEAIAKYCMVIIEKENKVTFFETLMNTCQEMLCEKNKVFFSCQNGNNQGTTSASWLAFIKFLNSMYSQLKRYRHTLKLEAKTEDTSPELMFLSLLCECCLISFKKESIKNLSEMECLFFVMTSIGRDLEQEMPRKLNTLTDSIRDAFFNPLNSPLIKKTLLQLIELFAAKWQLPANAVIYYYPSSSENMIK